MCKNPHSKLSDKELEIQIFQLKAQLKETQEELNKAKIGLKISQKNNFMGIWEVDLINNKQIWSHNYYRLLGYDEKIDEPSDELFLSHIHQDDLDFVKKSMQHSILTKTPRSIEFKYIPQDGSLRQAISTVDFIFDHDKNIIKIIGVFQDITEQKESTFQLKDSELKYKALYENAPISYQSLDENGNFIDVNTAWLSMLGYDRDEVVGKNYGDFLHPDCQHHFEVNFPEFKKRGYINDTQFKIRHKKGHYLYISFEGCIGTHPDGSFKQTYCVFKDITENKRIENELLSKNIVFDTSISANSTSDTNGILTTVNKAFLNLWGYESSDKVIGKSIAELIKYEYEVTEIINTLNKDGLWSGEYTALKKDGTEFVALANASALKDADNNFIGYQSSVLDITDRKNNEKELTRYKELLDIAGNISKTGGWELDLKTMESYFSRETFNIHELDTSTAPGIAGINFYAPEARLIIEKAIAEAIEQQKPYDLEVPFITAKGKFIWVRTIGRVEVKNNKTVRLYGVIQDITKRRKADQKLILNEKRLTALVELSQMNNKSVESIYDFTLKKAIELTQSQIGFLGFVNEDETEVEISNWSDSTMKQCMGKDVSMKFNVKDSGIWGDVIRKRSAVMINDYTEPNPRKKGFPSGHVAIKNYLSIPIFDDNKVVSMLSVANKPYDYSQTDVKQLTLLLDGMWMFLTQRKEREELQKSRDKAEANEERYRGLISNLYAGVVVHAADTSIIINNKRATTLLGLSDDQLKGKKAYDPEWHFTDINNNIIPIDEYPVNVIRRTKKSLNNYLFGVNRPATNDKGWLIVNGYPVLDNLGEVSEIVVSFIDFTLRKNTEEKLIAAKEKAEESDRLKSAFLANMSHEIRTPMNGILGFTELLQDSELSIENQNEYVKIIKNSGDRLLNTVNDIIEISKIESGEISINIEVVNIIRHLDALAIFYKQEAEEKGLDLLVYNDLNDLDLSIETDIIKLDSILTNLIKNAIKYTKTGAIKVGFTDGDGQLIFSCQDSGIGIPKDRQKAIFNRFEQVDIDGKLASQGSGLGLAIVKSYVQILGGEIWVESEEGKGSMFYVSLPCHYLKR